MVGERGLSGRESVLPDSAPFLSPRSSTSALLEPLEAYREGLALARRAGMSWFDAENAAWEAAMSVIPRAEELDPRLAQRRIAKCAHEERARREAERDRIEDVRDEWAEALRTTRTVWMRAYERRPTGCSL